METWRCQLAFFIARCPLASCVAACPPQSDVAASPSDKERQRQIPGFAPFANSGCSPTWKHRFLSLLLREKQYRGSVSTDAPSIGMDRTLDAAGSPLRGLVHPLRAAHPPPRVLLWRCRDAGPITRRGACRRYRSLSTPCSARFRRSLALKRRGLSRPAASAPGLAFSQIAAGSILEQICPTSASGEAVHGAPADHRLEQISTCRPGRPPATSGGNSGRLRMPARRITDLEGFPPLRRFFPASPVSGPRPLDLALPRRFECLALRPLRRHCCCK